MPAPYRTERLLLRELLDSDALNIVTLLNDPDWLRFIGDRGVRNETDALGYIARVRESYVKNHFGLYAVLHGAQWLGLCGLVRRDSLPGPDIGFALLPTARGQGFAKEAASATLLEADALGVNPLLAICNQDNLASRGVLERIGFVFDRLQRFEGPDELCVYVRRT